MKSQLRAISLMACSAILFGTGDINAAINLHASQTSRNVSDISTLSKEQKEIYDYFCKRLTSDKLEDFPQRVTISSTQYQQARDEIWNIWKMAVENSESQKLPETVSIERPDFDYQKFTETGIWNLRPGEDMKFLYGYKGQKPETGYPLTLFLHGSGDDSEREWRVNASWCSRYEDAPMIHFIPRSQEGGTKTRWFQPSRQKAWERLWRQAYLSGDVNPDKIYIAGISEGGYGSQRLASYYADYLAGVGPIAGGEPFYNCPPENTANIAFCQQTGSKDTWYGRSRIVAKAKRLWDVMEKNHPGYYIHKIDLQPGRYHGCDYTVATPWLSKFERNPFPKYVYWEDFAMGNANGEESIHRTGFYNLHVIEGANAKETGYVRDCYEMTIDRNEIDLTITEVTDEPSEEVTENDWTIKIGAKKTYRPTKGGKLRIYLNDQLVDLSRPVKVKVNGKTVFKGRVRCDVKDMVTSCAEFFDPRRLYPASIDVAY